MKCWWIFFHDWVVDMEYSDSYIPGLIFQRRKCKKCGKIQYEVK